MIFGVAATVQRLSLRASPDTSFLDRSRTRSAVHFFFLAAQFIAVQAA
jgi:hypothetical protein